MGRSFSPLEYVWSYRSIVSGPLGERAQPLLRVSENIRARLLFTLGVEFSLLVTTAVVVLNIIFEGADGKYGSIASLAGANNWFVAMVGVLFSVLLRPVMARLWRQELFFTFSLTQYVDDAHGLLTGQATDVVPFPT